jgi:Family of unknown function (DUF6159)
MDRIRRSWGLTKASWAVLQADRELLVFPLLSFVALIVVLITFIVPAWLVFGFTDPDTGGYNVGTIAFGFVFYVVAYAVMFFFNTALVGAAMIRLGGGDPTVSDGFRIARSRLPAIIGYAVIAATVGMILRFISERAGFVGQIVIGFLGFAWSVLTFVVVPVLAAEQIGPIDAVKRSGALLRKTWGEQLIGGGGIGLVFGFLVLGVITIGVFVTMALSTLSVAAAVVGVVIAAAVVGAISLIGAALAGIYSASLYRYATTGEAGAFDAEAMTAAFSQRQGGVRGILGA